MVCFFSTTISKENKKKMTDNMYFKSLQSRKNPINQDNENNCCGSYP